MVQSKLDLAVTGTTGNNTHSSVRCPDNYEGLAVQFVIEAVGATPTVTYKVQGSLDGTNWFDWGYVTDATDTIAVSPLTKTAVGAYVIFLSNPLARNYRFARLVTSSNTNVTYRGELYPI